MKNLPHLLLSFFKIVTMRWLWIVTGLIVIAASITFLANHDLQRSAQIGDFISGFAAALAFLWLIAGFRLQAREIALQREELKLQRLALENQAKELKNAAKFSSMSQIAAILDRALRAIAESGLGITQPSDIMTIWMQGILHWKEMFESNNANAVQARYLEWVKIEGLARGYVRSIAAALRIYMEHHLEVSFDTTKKDEEFVYVNQVFMTKAPYLSDHSGTAYVIAEMLFMFSPGLEALKVGGMFATKKVVGKSVFKEGALEQMRDELVKNGVPVPSIARD